MRTATVAPEKGGSECAGPLIWPLAYTPMRMAARSVAKGLELPIHCTAMSEADIVRSLDPRGVHLGRWRVSGKVWQQWREFFGDWNWRNFTLVKLSLEWADGAGYKGRYFEIDVGLFGFCGELEIWDAVDRAGALSPIERMVDDWEENHGEGAT